MSAFSRTFIASVFALASTGAALAAPIGLTKGTTYTQNFDSLATTGTANNLGIDGWALAETGSSARNNGQYAADDGGSATGDIYSYGTNGSTDRALGTLRSGTLVPVFGASFINNTGSTINSLLISYIGEQWRLGTAGRTDRLDFQYSFTASGVGDTTAGVWTDFDLLDFVTPNTTGTGAKNGNDAANRTAISATIAGLAIGNGSTFWIRWSDFSASGSQDGLAVDDFSLRTTTLPEPAGLALVAVALAGAVFSRRRSAR